MGPTPKCHFVLGLPSESPKIPTIGVPTTLGPHNFVCKPLIEMRSKVKLYPLSRTFQWYVTHHLHARKSGWFWLLVVTSQISNLTLDLSFGHNLCFKCPNGSHKTILNIYVPRAFQWYKEIFNPMGFGPFNFSLKIQKSTNTPTPKMGAHLVCEGSFSHTLLHSWEHEMWLPGFTISPHPCKPLIWLWA
jgi:hypothetical protein